MKLVPWRFFRTWECLACGLCCRRYIVSLSREEALRLMEKYGPWVISIEGGKYFLRRVNGACIFQRGNLCGIQDDKPIACRLWPFFILNKPIKARDRLLAEFNWNDYSFYVYVDPFCRGLNKGSTPIEKAIIEAIKIKIGEQKTQFYTTSKYILKPSIKKKESLRI
ncbi:MAG: YkgJ family cysteine cluster protein [Candidatus Njordarchaeales archaeon]